MKNMWVIFTTIFLMSCSSPTSSNSSNSNPGVSTNTFRIDFSAYIDMDSSSLTTNCIIYVNGFPSITGSSASFNSTALTPALGEFIKNDWSTSPSVGSSSNYSVTTTGGTYIGTVVMPSPLTSIQLAQGSDLNMSDPQVNKTLDLEVKWNNTASATTPQKVIAYIYGDYISGVTADFSAGTLTLPKNRYATGPTITFIYIYGFNSVVPTGSPEAGSVMSAGAQKRYTIDIVP